MTTSNQITINHIKNFFSLDGDLEEVDVAPTATGGLGIDNIQEFPPPKPFLSKVKKKETDYVNYYLEKEKLEFERKYSMSTTPASSVYSINDLEDVEDVSTAVGDLPGVNDLDNEVTKQIYSTYYNVPNRVYDANLNVTNYREEILQQLNINPVVIIQGPTGCGKTTQVPQYILDYHASRGQYCNIIVTQPRKIAAISIAKRVCQERGWQLGTFVGYQVALDPKVSADTRLSYVTTGVLLEKLVQAKNMNKYTHVIIDEVHERDQDIDFALLLVKKFLMTNSQRVKVVLMSATFDTSVFAKYFSLSSKGDLAPVIEITGKSKEVTEHYIEELRTLIPKMPEFDIMAPYIDPCLYHAVILLLYAFDKIEKSEQNIPDEKEYAPSRGAVLIFLPGYDDICALSEKMKMAQFNKKFWILPLHSMITLAEQSKVFMPAPANHRKVIISTNVAESSITVPDVKYVIDFCLTKSLVTDPLTNYTCLQLEWASKANCIQRKGRAGRVDIGKVYRLVPRQFYDHFPEYGTPEIKRCPLTSTILHLKKLDVCEPQEMLAFALDPPYFVDIENAVLQLKEALALYGKGSSQEGELTFIGNVMASLPLDIKLSKLILFGYVCSCLEECIIIAASLSLQSFFARPFQKALESYRSRLSWANYTFSDCLAYLHAFKEWKRLSNMSLFLKPGGMKENEWGERHYIQIKRIKEVDLLVKEIKGRLENHNIFVDKVRSQNYAEEDSKLILRLVMAGAFFPHYFVQDQLDEKEVMREINDNDPRNTVILTGLPPNHGLLYASRIKDMLSCCSERVDIDFEERKAYIKFEKKEAPYESEDYYQMPARSVSISVYMAVKMRLMRMPLELTVFRHDEAENKMKQILQLKKSDSEIVENKLLSNRFSVKMKPEFSLLTATLPAPDITFIKILIPYCNNCGHFWVRRYDSETDNHLRFFQTSILNLNKKELKPVQSPTVNMLCLAPYSEIKNGPYQYYRAQVREIANGMALVRFVDYGNEEKVKLQDLIELPESLPALKTTPALAIECFLAGVKPSIKYNNKWSKEAMAYFTREVNGIVLCAKIYSVVDNTMRLELQKTDKYNAVININEELVKRGYAEVAEESPISKQNHEFREKCSSYSTAKIFPGSSGFGSSLELSLEDTMAFSDLRRTNNKIRLRGPSNPLEVNYVGFTHLDRSKCIKVERDSVNSVSFNAEPSDKNTAMLIASGLTIGQKSDMLFARNTTLMPKILGLPSLICLMFCPFAEIRRDKAKLSYTGALCGLGFDPETGESLYPDHDIELEFDIEITKEDICTVNTVRMGFNMLLQPKDESKAVLNKYRDVLKEHMLKLIKTPRAPREPCPFSKSGQWNQVPAALLLQTSLDSSVDNPHVLPLHKPPPLAKP